MNAGGERDAEGGARDPEGGARDAGAEAVVRRLLAEAGGPLPMPPDVAARLDDVLAGLERERSATAEGSGSVVPLRRRRRWPRALLAAAAVVVGGYSVGTVALQGTLTGTDDSAPAAESAALDQDAGGDAERRQDDRAADRAEAGDQPAGPREGKVEALEDGAAEGSASSGYLVEAPGPPVRLRSDALATGVRRAMRVLDGRVGATTDTRSDLMLQRAGCPAPASARRSLSVRYDGEPAVLVAGPERRGRVRVTVYDCSGTVLASTFVAR